MIIPNKRIKPTIKFISDGDTLKLNYAGQDFHSRARWIDAPEMQKPGQFSDNPQILKHWEWAIKSKEFLASLITNKTLIIIPYEQDQYHRWLCDWYINTVSAATNIQLQMCLNGMCAYYLPFQHYNFTTRELSLYTGIIKNCAKAYKMKTGFWGDNILLPYEVKKLV